MHEKNEEEFPESDAIRLLWVDDDDDLRGAVGEMLSAAGFAVTPAESAEAALEVAPRVDPHLVITDFRLPGQNGLELAGALRSGAPQLPILLVSSQLADAELGAWREDPLFRTLAKPFDGHEIEARIDDLLEASIRQADDPRPARPAPARPPVEPTPLQAEPPAGRRTSPATWLAAAAALVLALGLFVLAPSLSRPADSPPLPDVPAAETKRGGTVLGLEPYGPIAEVPARLRWRPYEGAERYRVELTSLDGEVLLDMSSEGPELEVPAALAGALRPLSPYFWRVEALAGDSVLAVSETTRIRLIESEFPRGASSDDLPLREDIPDDRLPANDDS